MAGPMPRALVLIAAVLCPLVAAVPAPAAGPEFWLVSPDRGSLLGGTRVTIFGQGFSNASSTGMGNEVWIGDSQCELIQLHSTPNQLVCKTTAPSMYRDQTYEVHILVDGTKWATCTGAPPSNCEFRFRSDRMSVVDQLSTHAVVEPWEMLTVSGYMRFDDYTDEDFMSPSREVTSIAVKIMNKDGLPGDSALGGNGDFCQLFDPVTGDVFGYENGRNGYVKCAVTSVDREAGFYNVSLVQAGEYGEARIDATAWAYDLHGRPYSLAFAPKVNEVTPAAGSRAGGNLLTISGHTFSTNEDAVSVTVGDTPCDVESASLTQITCRLAHRNASDPLPLWQEGSRGIDMRFYKSGYVPGNQMSDPNIRNDVRWRSYTEVNLFDTPNYFGDHYASRHQAFFTAPRSGTYRFNIVGDDSTYLYAAYDGNPDNAEEVAGYWGHTSKTEHYKYSQQFTAPQWLEEGQRVYLRVESIEWGGGDHTGVAVEILEAEYTSLEVTGEGIEAPRQTLRLRYSYAPERQTVRITPTTGSARDLSGTFTLAMNGFTTPPIQYNASAATVYEALVDMQAMQCEYPTDTSPTQRFFDLDQMETIEDTWLPRNGVVPYQALGRAYCGRYGMGVRANYARNWEGSVLEVNQTERVWRTSAYPYMCAAFNVPARVSANILLYVSGLGWRSISVAQDNDVEYDINYPVMGSFGFKEDGIAGDGKWHYRCINVWEQMREADPSREYHDISAVIFHNSGAPNYNGHFYTDEFSISTEPREVVRTGGFSLPRDTHIQTMTVDKEYSDEFGVEYSFDFRSFDCADGFSAFEADVSGMTGPVAAVVERTKVHSPTPAGQVSVTIANQTASWHPLAHAIDVEAAFREQTSHNVEVTTSYRCENSEMRFHMRVLDHRGGIGNLFEVDDSELENIWDHNMWFNRRGGTWANRLAGAYLTVPVQSEHGRVVVRVNEQSAVCDDDSACEYDFQEALTPTVTAASFDAPSSVLTVTGHRFGTNADVVRVWTGEHVCDVSAVTDDEIQCTLAAYSAGEAEVMVMVEGVGLANTTAWAELPVKVAQATPSSAYNLVETEVLVQGNGFSEQADLNEVMIGDQACVVTSAAGNQLKCRTVNEGTPGIGQDVRVLVKALMPVVDPETNETVVGAVELAQDVLPGFFDILPYTAPTAKSVDPAIGSARGGTSVEVSGTNLNRDGLQVFLGAVECDVTSRGFSRIVCTTGAAQPGNYSVTLVEEGLPTVVANVTYRYHLEVTSVQGVVRGSWAGGAAMRVVGSGFTPSEAGGDDASVVLRATLPEVHVVSLYAARPATAVQQVAVTATAIDEVQWIAVANATGGTFTLSFGGDTTAPLAWDTNEYVIKASLEALDSLSLVRVTPEPTHEAVAVWAGSAWKVTFMGGLGDVPLLGADATNLITDPAATETAVALVQPAREGNAPGGTFTLSSDGEESVALAVDASAADVKAALDALEGTGGVWVERETLPNGHAWLITFDNSVPEGSRPELAADSSLVTGSGRSVHVSTIVDGTQPVAGSFTVAVGGVWTEPLPANATAAEVEAAVAPLPSVVPGSVSVRRVDDQPGKKFGSWYPHQWILSFQLRAAAAARSDLVCTQPMRINWRPQACPTYAADLYLSYHVAEFPVFMNRPASYGSPAHRAQLQGLCDAEAVAAGLTVGGCESELVAQSRPYCAGAAAAHGSSAPPCWEVRWTTVRVVHRDGTEAVYVQQNQHVSSDTQKGYRHWRHVDEIEAAEAAMTRVSMMGLIGTGVGMDVVRRRAGGAVEVTADVTSRSDSVIEATAPLVPSGMVPDYAADLQQIGAVVPQAYWTMAGSHAATRIVKNSGLVGTAADGEASMTEVLPAGADPPGFDLVVVDGSAYLEDGLFAGVTVPFVTALNLHRSITVEGWFAPSSATVAADGDTPLVSSMDPEYGAGYALMLSNGAWEFWVGPGRDPPTNPADAGSLRPNRTRYVTVASPSAAQANTWTHVAGVYDSEMGTIQVFVNGVASPAVDVFTYTANTRAKLRIGGTCAIGDGHQCGVGGACRKHPVCVTSGNGVTLTNATALPYGGFIDEVAVYNAALDSTELSWHAGYAAAASSQAQVYVAFGTASTATCTPATATAGAAACGFTYASDASPGLAAALPRRQSPGAPFMLVGVHLDMAGVEVRFGGADWGCTAASGAQMSCMVPPTQAGGVVPVTCSVPGGVGDCVVDDTAMSVTVVPVISLITGNETSLMGGNDIVITGSGFGNSANAVHVGVSWWECDVVAVTPTSVTCTAPAIPDSEFPEFITPGLGIVYPLTVSVNDVQAMGCGDMPCGVAYLEELTPQITATEMVLGGDGSTALVEGATLLVTGLNLDIGTGAAGTFGDNRLRLGTGHSGGDFVDCVPQARADGAEPSDMEFNCTVGTGPGGSLPATFRAGGVRGLVMGKKSVPMVKQVVVTDVQPAVGSMAGGTLLNVTGRGFSKYPAEIYLWMGAGSCVVQEATTSWFTCLTPPVGGYYGDGSARRVLAAPPSPAAVFAAAPAEEAQAALAAMAGHTAPLGRELVENPGVSGHKNRPGVIDASLYISVNGHASPVTCAADAVGPCPTAFAYNISYTPVITSVSVDGAGVQVTVTGNHFESDVGLNDVIVGGAPCPLDSASETTLVCTLGSALKQAGSYAVNVLVAGQGAAERHVNSTAADVSVVVPVMVTGIDVAAGSVAGGIEVTLTGSGFDSSPDENSVHVCGAACPVSAATDTSLTCQVPSALHPKPLNDGRLVLTIADGIDDVEERTGTGRVQIAGSTGVTSCAAGTGVSYRGPQNRTREGHTCQNWRLDFPHSHGQNGPNEFRGTDDHNYCRNPDSENEGPWCYTTTTTKRWDWCDVPQCSQADNLLSFGDPQIMQGLRFTGVDVPQGATVTSAHLRFTALHRSCSVGTSMLVRVEDADDARPFSAVFRTVSSRKYMHDVNATWEPTGHWTWAGGSEESSDIANVITAVVNRPGWRAGGAIALMVSPLTGESACAAHSAEDGPDKAPQLVLEYDAPAVSTADVVAMVKDCDVTVSVTAKPDGMSGKVLDFEAAGDAVSVGEEWQSLLPIVDLSNGGSATASSSEDSFQREMLVLPGKHTWQSSRDQCLNRGGDLCTSWQLCEPYPKYRWTGEKWYDEPYERNYAPTLDGAVDRGTWGTWVHISNGPPYGHSQSCNTFRRMHGGFWTSNGDYMSSDYKGHIGCCYGQGFPTSNLVDGQYMSSWRSAPDAGSDGSPVELVVDIRGGAINSTAAGTQVVRKVAVEFEDEYFALAYTVELSVDGEAWTTVVDFDRGTATTITHELRTMAAPFGHRARYVRVRLLEPAVMSSEGGALYRVRNVRVTGHASSVSSTTVAAGSTGSFQYRGDAAPVVDRVIAHGRTPARGTTAGNTHLTIVGTGFTAAATVTVGSMDCPVQAGGNATHIFCLTPAVKLTEGGLRRVTVTVPGVGASLPSERATFLYADLWSSPTTWGGSEPPVGCGDFEHDRECVDSVIIPKGQVITLDVSPPRFFLILVQGTLVFDPEAPELELQATYLLVHGGTLQIGTEDEPHQGKATITLFGHFGNRELPTFGSKVLGCYKCTLDLHGQEHPRVWTRLAERANVGSTQIQVQHPVTSWPVGAWVVLATTSHDREQNEVRRITAVSGDGLTLTLAADAPLEYMHLSDQLTIGGRDLEFAGEVALLSRNIVIQGDADSHNCGPESVAEDGTPLSCNFFGGHVFLHSPGHESLEARVSGVEFRNTGQAFRLGRYALHYHMIGNVRRSYVRKNSFHHSWNRGLALHGVNFLRVENNVAFKVRGHSYFIEDGVEHGNVLNGNLGIRTISASSLLNTDMTPAVFWVTNPNNEVTNNVAVASDNYGFWYRPEIAATGTSSHTPDVHPVFERLGTYRGNTAHSHGRYGLRIYPTYHPTAVATFEDLFTWRNLVGLVPTEMTLLKFDNIVAVENRAAGWEARQVVSEWGDMGIYNSLFVGATTLPTEDTFTPGRGIWLPFKLGMEVYDVTFVNYTDGQGAFHFCAHCGRGGSPSAPNGGFETRTRGLTFIDTPQRATFRHVFEGILHDMDGTLTGLGPDTYMIGDSNLIPPAHCSSTDMSTLLAGGAVCTGDVRPRRVWISPPQPTEFLDGVPGLISSEQGADVMPYIKKAGGLQRGYMFTAFANYRYTLDFDVPNVDVKDVTIEIDEIADDEILYISQRIEEWLEVDIIGRPLYNSPISSYLGVNDQPTNWTTVFGDDKVGTALVPRPTEPIGSYVMELDADENGGLHTMLFKGCGDRDDKPNCLVALWMRVRPCPGTGCWPPPPLVDLTGKESFNRTWSNATTWAGNPTHIANPLNLIDPEDPTSLLLQQEWAGDVPQDGDSVWIPKSMTVIIDVNTPDLDVLIIDGTLLFSDDRDVELRARHIVINGGLLGAGTPTRPHQHMAIITLLGDLSTRPELLGREGIEVGGKSLIVAGNLTLYGQPRSTWTRLAVTAEAGDDVVTVQGAVNWQAGDTIIVASTTYDPAWAEHRTVASTAPGATPGTTDVKVTEALAHRHFSGEESHGTRSMEMRAEVAVVSHNVVIQGSDDAGDDIGGQLIVAEYTRDVWDCSTPPCVPGFVQDLEGNAQVHNVEIRKMGQFGRDGRSAVVINAPVGGANSDFSGSSIHTSFNRAFHVLRATGMEVRDLVVVGSVGSSYLVDAPAVDTVLRHNMGLGMMFPTTYKGLNGKEQREPVRAVFEIKGTRTRLFDNAAAGSERGSYSGVGIPQCGLTTAQRDSWMHGNTGHSALFGWFAHGLSSSQCSTVHGFTFYKILDYGVFWEVSNDVEGSQLRIADTKVGIAMILVGPHWSQRKKSQGKVTDVMIVGSSANEECGLPSISPYMCKLANAWCKSPNAPHVGMFIPTFASNFNMGPRIKEWTSGDSYPAVEGTSFLTGVTFAKFDTMCNKRAFMIKHNPLQPDASGPLHVAQAEVVASSEDSVAKIEPPKSTWVALDDCVNMDCPGPKHVFVHDADGTLLGGTGGYVLPRAEYVSPPAVAGTVPPKTLMSDRLGNPLTEAEVMPNGYGLVRPGCTLNPTWNAYKCGDALTYRRFVMENLDSDREIRALSPVAISADGWTDLMNECQDHGWCQSYTCLKRLTTYHAVVATGRTYTIHLTGSNPVKTRFHLIEAAADESLVVYVYYTGGSRLQVFTGATGDNFIEDLNLLDGKRKALLHKQGRLAGNNPDGSWTDEDVSLGDAHGTNTYDRRSKMLRVVIKGDQPLTVVQMPVVQVGMNLAVSEADFYAMQSEFISSIASMLGIPPERIAITDVVADTGLARRLVRDYDGQLRERRMAEGVQVEFEVTPSPEVNLQAEDVEVLETVGSITVTLTRSVNVFGAVNVTYDTVNGTGVWGTHFERVHGMLTFADKEVTKTLTVPILPTAEYDAESPRTMTIQVEATGGGVTGSRSAVAVTIHSVTPPVPGAATLSSLPSPAQMTVGWTARAWPNAPDGYGLASQQLQRRVAGAADWSAAVSVTLSSTATSRTVMGLDTYSAHEFRLRVGTQGGAWGTWGPTSAVLRTASQCGDGRRHGTEGCDDGNTGSGDGCSLLCQPEPGFSCSGGETGGSDTCAAGCGDGLRAGAEQCDAKGESAGCNDACRVVAGWTCTGGSPSSKDTCTATCGDGVTAAGAEECDDNNSATGDGCDATCEIEPDFTCVSDATGLSVCQSCGNGKTEGTEVCDDGGAAGGCNDACSGIDAGWLCSGGSSSAPDVCVGGPATPQAPTSKLITDSSITFSWLAVQGNGLPITGYTLEYRDEAAPDVWTAMPSTTELKVKLVDLRSSASFRARVTATTAAGSSPASPLGAIATTLDAEETVELETDSNASDELNGLMDNLLSGAATSDYLDGLGVGGFELVPPPPPPEVPLEDDGSIENLDDVEDLLNSLDGNSTLADDIEVPDEEEEEESDVGVGVSIGPGEFSFAKATGKVSESGGSISVTVKRENGAFGAVAVAYATADLTAIAGQHYTALAGVLAFAKGELEKTLTVSVTNNDEFVNTPPKFTLTLSAPTGGATLGTIPVITISIQEDDTATLLEFTSTTASVAETAGSVTLSLQRSRATGLDMVATVQLTELNGAAQGTVFGGARTRTVTVAGGAAATFSVPVIDLQTSVATLRKFKVTVSSTTNGLVGSAAAVTVDVTHVDCRPRDACANGAACGAVADCLSGVCTGAGVCAATATCLDGAKNQGESDIDCGGPCATKCVLTKMCAASSDCVPGAVCGDANTCVPEPTCFDGAKNGVESDVDCGGACLATCATGKMCARDIDCGDGDSCDDASNTCVPDNTCSDGVKSSGEADIDCGGVCRATCDEGATCSSDLDCSKGACVGGSCSATHLVGGELTLVGYRPEEVTDRVLQLLRAGLADHLGVSYAAVHAWLKGSGGSVTRRVLVRSASDQASIEYTVYAGDATAAQAAASKMSDSSQASALSSALAAEGVDALEVQVASTSAVVALNPDGDGSSTKSGFTSTMLLLVIGGAAVALVGIIVIMYTAGLCCCRQRPTVQPTAAKGSAPTPTAPDGTVRALSPEYVARLEARGEYIAGGKVYNPNQPGTSHAIDPQAFTYYKSQALPAPINSRVKPWQHRQVNQKAFEPATVAGVIEHAKMTITTPARRRSGARSPAGPTPSGVARAADRQAPSPAGTPTGQGQPALSSPPGSTTGHE